MSVALRSVVVDDTIKPVFAHRRLKVARQLDVLLDLNPVVYLLIVHLLLAEDEALEVDDQYLWQRADLCLFRNVPQLFAVVAVQLFSLWQVLHFEELSQDVVESDRCRLFLRSHSIASDRSPR